MDGNSSPADKLDSRTVADKWNSGRRKSLSRTPATSMEQLLAREFDTVHEQVGKILAEARARILTKMPVETAIGLPPLNGHAGGIYAEGPPGAAAWSTDILANSGSIATGGLRGVASPTCERPMPPSNVSSPTKLPPLGTFPGAIDLDDDEIEDVGVDSHRDSYRDSVHSDGSMRKKDNNWNVPDNKSHGSHKKKSRVSAKITKSGKVLPKVMDAADAEEEVKDVDIMDLIKGRASAMNSGQTRGVRAILSSVLFDIFIAFSILSNTIFLGVQIDYAARYPNEPQHIAIYIVGYMYTVIFGVEVVLRLIDEGYRFFSVFNRSVLWNYLDFFIVMSSLVEVYFDILLATNSENPDGMDADQIKIVRIIRISRLMKIFRIVRIMRYIRGLRTLVYSIVCTLKSVFWALTLMGLIIYVFGMILTQAVSDFVIDGGSSFAGSDLTVFWGDLSLSILTLFKAIAGGLSWHDCFEPLQDMNPIWKFVFLSYVIFLYFAVMNVITGVFCESAIQSAKNDQELVIQEMLIKQQNYVKKLTTLFKDIDSDESGQIGSGELSEYMENEMSGAFFEYLELEVDSAQDVIKLIDVDGSGEIDMNEFIFGLCRLRGAASKVDVAGVQHDIKMFQETLRRDLRPIVEWMAEEKRQRLGGV